MIGSKTGDTLLLAMAAARNEALGTTAQTATQWAADPANAQVIAAVDQDVATNMANQFSNYQFSTVVTSSQIPPTTTLSNSTVGTANIYCEIHNVNDSAAVQIALDPTRGVFVMKQDNTQMVGNYNAQTGAVSLNEIDPLTSKIMSGVTYNSEGLFLLNGTIDIATGKISGNYSEATTKT